jgi:homoserine O-acetyltransferase
MIVESIFGEESTKYKIGNIATLGKDEPLLLDCGQKISNFDIAYQTYGKLNKDKSNAILICHPITADQYVASKNPVTKKSGWWDFMVGAEKPIDTDKFFVICSNVIGGCFGSFGPKETNPETKKPYGADFPVVTVFDMVRAQEKLANFLGIDKLHAVIGGSAGGMQAISWAFLFPHKINLCISVAASYRHSAQNIAFNEVARQAIINDLDWCIGKYLEEKKYPSKGLALARMMANITYLSEDSLHQKFGRNLQDKNRLLFNFANAEFAVESYLRYQGNSFIKRFDPNSYLYITKALDYFDLERESDGDLSSGFKNCPVKFCIISYSDDWLFPASESQKLAKSLSLASADVSLVNIKNKSGHDGFLLDKEDSLKKVIGGFL